MSRQFLGAAAAAVIGAGLICLPQSAMASTGDSIECTNGTYGTGQNAARCFLNYTNGASQEAWTVYGSSWAPGAGQATITFVCGKKDTVYTVSVRYVDGSGASNLLYDSGTCGEPNP